jgi:hypothetical protein
MSNERERSHGMRGGLQLNGAVELSTARPEAAARLLELIQMRLISEAIHVVAALEIADLLANASMSAAQLAEATGAHEPSIRRVMRALTSFGVFSQESESRFALALLGEFLKRDMAGSLHGAALFFGGGSGAQVIRLFLECVNTGESATRTLADVPTRIVSNATLRSFGITETSKGSTSSFPKSFPISAFGIPMCAASFRPSSGHGVRPFLIWCFKSTHSLRRATQSCAR